MILMNRQWVPLMFCWWFVIFKIFVFIKIFKFKVLSGISLMHLQQKLSVKPGTIPVSISDVFILLYE